MQKRMKVPGSAAYLTLSEISYIYGLIGIGDYAERQKIARWLWGEDDTYGDPRNIEVNEGAGGIKQEEGKPHQRTDTRINSSIKRSGGSSACVINFICAGLSRRWVFTKSDPDPYPSVPHGHLQRATIPWPKLNPYIGRAFSAPHSEDLSLRLQRHEMQALWRDVKFIQFTREMLLWYIDAFPHHQFSVAQPLRMPRWR